MASVITAGTASNTALNLTGDTSGELQLKTNNGSTTAMTLTTGGNVGIGTSSPIAPLTIASSTTIAVGLPSLVLQGENNTERIAIYSAGTSGNATPVFLAASTRGTIASPTPAQGGDPLGYYQFGGYDGSLYSRSAWVAGFAAETYSATNRGSFLVFSTTPTGSTTIAERMRIDSSGNVGIGSAPTAVGSYKVLQITGGSTSVGGLIRLETSDGSSGVTRIYSANSGGYIEESSNLPLIFLTNGTDRGRFDAVGNFAVGNSSGISRLQVFGSNAANLPIANFRQDGASANIIEGAVAAGALRFVVAVTGNVTNTNGSYGTISDIKNKENIVDATPKLEKVNQLKVRNYNLIGNDLKQIGFVAQELEEVFPSMVEEHQDKDENGQDLGTTTKTIKTTVLIPILVKAIQELNAKVEAQAAEIQALKGAK